MASVIEREITRVRVAREANQQEQDAFDREEALLNQVLAVRRARQERTASHHDSEAARPRHRDGIAATILYIMEDEAGAWLSYDDVQDRLAEQGIHASRNVRRTCGDSGMWRIAGLYVAHGTSHTSPTPVPIRASLVAVATEDPTVPRKSGS